MDRFLVRSEDRNEGFKSNLGSLEIVLMSLENGHVVHNAKESLKRSPFFAFGSN